MNNTIRLSASVRSWQRKARISQSASASKKAQDGDQGWEPLFVLYEYLYREWYLGRTRIPVAPDSIDDAKVEVSLEPVLRTSYSQTRFDFPVIVCSTFRRLILHHGIICFVQATPRELGPLALLNSSPKYYSTRALQLLRFSDVCIHCWEIHNGWPAVSFVITYQWII